MKRALSLLTFVVLLGSAPVLAQPADLPADARFDQLVSFSTGNGGESLGAMVTALARSVGLTPVIDDVPDKVIVYDIGEPKPFRQVWALILTLNDLDYLLEPNDIVVLGTAGSLGRLRTAPPSTVEVGVPRVQRFYRVNNEVDQVVEVLRLTVPDARIDALPGTGAIVVVATESQQAAVVETLAEFDQRAEVVPLEQRTYFLSNADAADLAVTLERTGVLGVADGEAGARLDDFTVVAEPRTNSLIVTGSTAVQARLAGLIASLDSAQRQVNVQVRIQEITRRSAIDLGINWSGGIGNFTANILTGGLNFIFNTSQVISSLNILAVLDALETQGLSRRVDDTNVTVLNNGTATLQSGGTIFISIAGGAENIERTIPYGVQVDVTPRISNDGRVTLLIEARVEDVLSTTNDPTFLNLSSRTLSTTVTVEEGQTLLLGGLLQNSLTVSRQRIPIIGSIPLIGDLLGKTITEEDNTDLLLIVNATIVD
jgi:type II secretory pathway component GspD/PulD (secretin)